MLGAVILSLMLAWIVGLFAASCWIALGSPAIALAELIEPGKWLPHPELRHAKAKAKEHVAEDSTTETTPVVDQPLLSDLTSALEHLGWSHRESLAHATMILAQHPEVSDFDSAFRLALRKEN